MSLRSLSARVSKLEMMCCKRRERIIVAENDELLERNRPRAWRTLFSAYRAFFMSPKCAACIDWFSERSIARAKRLYEAGVYETPQAAIDAVIRGQDAE
jgi:hypothetical protein